MEGLSLTYSSDPYNVLCELGRATFLLCLVLFKPENGGNHIYFSSSQHCGENSKVINTRVFSTVSLTLSVYWHHLSSHLIPLCPGFSSNLIWPCRHSFIWPFSPSWGWFFFTVCTPENLQIFLLLLQIFLLGTFIYLSKNSNGTFSIEHPSLPQWGSTSNCLWSSFNIFFIL